MINNVGESGMSRIETVRTSLERGAPVAKAGSSLDRNRAEAPVSAAAEMAAKGPPIDADKVAAIRAAIAEGRYPVQPDRIADAMIDLGFNPKA